jgi:hypothetical protein
MGINIEQLLSLVTGDRFFSSSARLLTLFAYSSIRMRMPPGIDFLPSAVSGARPISFPGPTPVFPMRLNGSGQSGVAYGKVRNCGKEPLKLIGRPWIVSTASFSGEYDIASS